MTQDEIYYYVRDSESMSFVRKEAQETTDRLLAARPEAAALLKAPALSAISSLCLNSSEKRIFRPVVCPPAVLGSDSVDSAVTRQSAAV